MLQYYGKGQGIWIHGLSACSISVKNRVWIPREFPRAQTQDAETRDPFGKLASKISQNLQAPSSARDSPQQIKWRAIEGTNTCTKQKQTRQEIKFSYNY